MTSVDSGVETGNDSNDSIVATATAIGQQIAGSSITTVATIKQTDKQQQEEQQILQLQLLQQQHHHQVMQEHMQQVLLQQQQQQQQEAGPSIIRIGFSPAVWPVDLHFPIASSMYHMERYFTDGITALKMMVPDVPMYDSTEMSARRSCLRDNMDSVPVFRCCKRRHRRVFCKGCYLPNERRMRVAAATNNIYHVKDLLDLGISPNNQDEHGRTPLHHAACRGFTEMVRLLLEHGANPNKRDCIGNTPLHLAAVTSKISVVTLLLIAGTNVLSSDQHGYNPLQLAQTKLKMMQNCNDSDMDKIRKEMHDIVDMLVAYLQKQTNMQQKVETLSNFCSRLSLSNTSDQIQDDVKDLLASIETLSITS